MMVRAFQKSFGSEFSGLDTRFDSTTIAPHSVLTDESLFSKSRFENVLGSQKNWDTLWFIAELIGLVLASVLLYSALNRMGISGLFQVAVKG